MVSRFIASLQRGACALMDGPAKEAESSANFYLTAHCLSLILFLMLLDEKCGIDLIALLREAWPVKPNNFRDPRSLSFALTVAVGGPIYVFWSRVGKSNKQSNYLVIAMPHYMSITFASSIAVNIVLLFVAAKLELPEISFALGVLNFVWWANWTVRKYSERAEHSAHG